MPSGLKLDALIQVVCQMYLSGNKKKREDPHTAVANDFFAWFNRGPSKGKWTHTLILLEQWFDSPECTIELDIKKEWSLECKRMIWDSLLQSGKNSVAYIRLGMLYTNDASAFTAFLLWLLRNETTPKTILSSGLLQSVYLSQLSLSERDQTLLSDVYQNLSLLRETDLEVALFLELAEKELVYNQKTSNLPMKQTLLSPGNHYMSHNVFGQIVRHKQPLPSQTPVLNALILPEHQETVMTLYCMMGGKPLIQAVGWKEENIRPSYRYLLEIAVKQQDNRFWDILCTVVPWNTLTSWCKGNSQFFLLAAKTGNISVLKDYRKLPTESRLTQEQVLEALWEAIQTEQSQAKIDYLGAWYDAGWPLEWRVGFALLASLSGRQILRIHHGQSVTCLWDLVKTAAGYFPGVKNKLMDPEAFEITEALISQALETAAAEYNWEVVKYLMTFQAPLQPSLTALVSAIGMAIKRNELSMVKYIKARLPTSQDLHKILSQMLVAAAGYGQLDIVQYLCSTGGASKIGQDGILRALVVAAENWHRVVITYLLNLLNDFPQTLTQGDSGLRWILESARQKEDWSLIQVISIRLHPQWPAWKSLIGELQQQCQVASGEKKIFLQQLFIVLMEVQRGKREIEECIVNIQEAWLPTRNQLPFFKEESLDRSLINQASTLLQSLCTYQFELVPERPHWVEEQCAGEEPIC